MNWIKINNVNKPLYIDLGKLYKIEEMHLKGELWLYFIGETEPTKICNSSKQVLNQILSEISKVNNLVHPTISNTVEVNYSDS